MKKSTIIIMSVIAAVVVATGLGVLIWWLVTDEPRPFETILLQGEGLSDVPRKAAFTRTPYDGDTFWLFYPTISTLPTTRPIILWLDGVVGPSPSLMANLGLFGPYDLNLNRRSNSLINDYNLLFVDAPLGTGFSKLADDAQTPSNLQNTTDHLLYTLESFYHENKEFSNTPIYIIGQGYGAQLALSLASAIQNYKYLSPNLRGVVLGNPIISPALVLSKLGFYMEEMGYIDFKGRSAIEDYVQTINTLLNEGQYETAYEYYLNLDRFIDEETGAASVNSGHIVEKVTNGTYRDYFGQLHYLQQMTGFTGDFQNFMTTTYGPALGINEPNFDSQRQEVIQQFAEAFMTPAVDKVEQVLNDTDLTVTIYNSNLDAISNTPGQLEWINNLRWSGQEEFLNSPRQTLVVSGLIEGYFRETEKFTFYWVNVAGLLVPLDNPVAFTRIVQRVMDRS